MNRNKSSDPAAAPSKKSVSARAWMAALQSGTQCHPRLLPWLLRFWHSTFKRGLFTLHSKASAQTGTTLCESHFGADLSLMPWKSLWSDQINGHHKDPSRARRWITPAHWWDFGIIIKRNCRSSRGIVASQFKQLPLSFGNHQFSSSSTLHWTRSRV